MALPRVDRLADRPSLRRDFGPSYGNDVLDRRSLLAALAASPWIGHGSSKSYVGEAQASPQSDSTLARRYRAFLNEVATQARKEGVSSETARHAFSRLTYPNQKVLHFHRTQPEVVLSFSSYRKLIIPHSCILKGRAKWQEYAPHVLRFGAEYGVDPKVVVSIWGIESDYGAHTGTFSVIDSLATLGFSGRKASYFRRELLCALKIIERGEVTAENMLGSYAGAMGQVQFMPSSYLDYAVDADGDGQPDIWKNSLDALASIANFLHSFGWRKGEPWGQPVKLADDIKGAQIGRRHPRTLKAWARLGVSSQDGTPLPQSDLMGSLLQPDGQGREAFLVYHNFDIIRRYNASDHYALCVGLLSNAPVSREPIGVVAGMLSAGA